MVDEVNLVRDCPECGVAPGNWHRVGCCVELCPYCGDSLGSWGAAALKTVPLDDRIPWEGICPSERAAVEFGWFCRQVPNGLVACKGNARGAMPDLERVQEEARWSRQSKRFVRKGS